MVNLLPVPRVDGKYSLVNQLDPALVRIRERTQGAVSPEVIETIVEEELSQHAKFEDALTPGESEESE